MKKRVILIAVILIAAGLLIFCCVLAAISNRNGKNYETNTYTVEDSFDKIEINSKETNIVLEPSADGNCKVVCEEREKIKHTVLVEDGTLKVKINDTRSWFDHISFFPKAMTMTVYLPMDAYAALQVESGTGNITIPANFTFGSAAVTVSTGDILWASPVTGSLTLNAGTGDIAIKNGSAKSISLSVSTGKITAESIACEEEFVINVSTGKTNLTGVTCKALTSTGSTGKITLNNVVANDLLQIERSTGDVRLENCDAGEIKIKTSTGDMTGTLKSEKIFFASASTGKVRVPKTTSGGICEITTSTGDIEIEIEK